MFLMVNGNTVPIPSHPPRSPGISFFTLFLMSSVSNLPSFHICIFTFVPKHELGTSDVHERCLGKSFFSLFSTSPFHLSTSNLMLPRIIFSGEESETYLGLYLLLSQICHHFKYNCVYISAQAYLHHLIHGVGALFVNFGKCEKHP